MFFKLFEELEQRKSQLGVNGFGVTAASLEEVFLNVAERAETTNSKPDHQQQLAPKGNGGGGGGGFGDAVSLRSEASVSAESLAGYTGAGAASTEGGGLVATSTSADGIGGGSVKHNGSALFPQSAAVGSAASGPAGGGGGGVSAATGLSTESGLYTGPMLTGWTLTWSRFRALFRKRWQHAKHDQKALLSQIALPALFVLIGMFVATAFPPPDDAPPIRLSGTAALKQECVAKATRTLDVHVPYVQYFDMHSPCAHPRGPNNQPSQWSSVVGLVVCVWWLGAVCLAGSCVDVPRRVLGWFMMLHSNMNNLHSVF
jgi:hypothetical protein